MRHAAGQSADGLDLLRLDQACGGLFDPSLKRFIDPLQLQFARAQPLGGGAQGPADEVGLRQAGMDRSALGRAAAKAFGEGLQFMHRAGDAAHEP